MKQPLAADPDERGDDSMPSAGESAAPSALARMRAELEERDDVLAMAAHELRNPLHALALQLTLAHNTAVAAGQSDTSRRIAKAQATLARYSDRVTVLMDLMHGYTGRYPLVVRSFDLSVAVRALIDSLAPEARFRGVALCAELPPSCVVVSDPVVLEQVVDNLVLNALKHSVCRQVVVRARESDGFVELEVEDDGRGIPAQDQQRIFGKFAMATSNPRSEGSGLGLWIVRKLLAALEGDITLDSKVGRGSIFKLRIPMIQSSCDRAP